MRRLIQRLYPYCRQYKRFYAAGAFVVVLTNLLYIWKNVMIGRAVDYVVGTDLRLSRLAAMLGGILGMVLIGAIAHYLQRIFIIITSRKIEFAFRNDFFHHLMRLSPSYYDRMKTGDIVSRATSDVEQVRAVLGPGIMYPLSSLTLLPMSLFVMLQTSWPTATISLLPVLVVPVLVYVIASRMYRMSLSIQEHFSEFSGRIQEAITGVRVVRSFVQEDHELETLDRLNEENARLNLALARVQALFRPLLITVFILGMLLIIWVGGHNVTTDETLASESSRMLTIGQLLALTLLYRQLFWPILGLGWVVSVYQRGAASLHRMELIWNEKPAIRDSEETDYQLETLEGEIRFENLTFAYPGAETPALRNVSMRVPRGKTLGVVGSVGSGKSTIAHLIARLYDPPKGTVFLDGADVRSWPIEKLRSSIGIVFQETYLFSDTIKNNICFGFADEPPGEIAEDAAEVADVRKDILEFPRGFETDLGERGINLSGGQKQRVALARAIACEPPILILDDAFASVDTQTEERILQSLRNILKGRTTILVSHRISTVKLADHIIVLDDGAIVEQGRHEDLVEQEGLYADIHRRQLLEESIQQDLEGEDT